MPRRNPDHRAIVVARSASAPEHPIERAYWDARRGLLTDDAVIRAMELHESSARDCLRGWLLATQENDKISKRTRVTEEVLQAYRHLFFDVTVFRDHFDLVDWARTEAASRGATPEGGQYIRWAIMHGVEAIAYMSGLPANVDPHVVQTQAMVESHFRALIGRDVRIDSAAAREALKHQQIAVTQAAMLAKRSPSVQGIAIKLKHRELTAPIEVIDRIGEVLH